jgi:hypothetical protein
MTSGGLEGAGADPAKAVRLASRRSRAPAKGIAPNGARLLKTASRRAEYRLLGPLRQRHPE